MTYLSIHITCGIYTNPRSHIFKILQQLMKGQLDNPLTDCSSQEELVDKFANFFINDIRKIRSQFLNSNLYTPPSRNCSTLTYFRPTNQDETLKLLNNIKKTTCDMDPCIINFLMKFKDVLLVTQTKVINTSYLNSSFFQP